MTWFTVECWLALYYSSPSRAVFKHFGALFKAYITTHLLGWIFPQKFTKFSEIYNSLTRHHTVHFSTGQGIVFCYLTVSLDVWLLLATHSMRSASRFAVSHLHAATFWQSRWVRLTLPTQTNLDSLKLFKTKYFAHNVVSLPWQPLKRSTGMAQI